MKKLRINKAYFYRATIVFFFQLILGCTNSKKDTQYKTHTLKQSNNPTETQDRKQDTLIPSNAQRRPAAKPPVVPSLEISTKTYEPIPIHKLPVPNNSFSPGVPSINFRTSGLYKPTQEQIEREKKELMKPKAPITPSLKLDTHTFVKSPAIPLPRICADGRPCDKLFE